MQRVSSNLTLIYKFFFPVLYASLFGAVALALLVYGYNPLLRFGFPLLYLLTLVLLYVTVFQLKRVEMDESFVYVTNYFRHFRYPYHNVEKIQERNFILFRLVTIHFRKPGFFGKKVNFLPSSRSYDEFWETHPLLRVDFLRKS